MKQIFILSCIFLFVTLSVAHSQVKSGIVIGVSNSYLGESTNYSYHSGTELAVAEKWQPQLKLNLGYQFQFELPHHFIIDAAILGQATKAKVSSSLGNDDAWLAGMSVNGLIGYQLWKGLRAGVGVEPTIYFNTNSLSNNLNSTVFDCPLLVKVGCQLKRCELALTYKHGWSSLYQSPAMTSVGGARDFQLSLFVPLFR